MPDAIKALSTEYVYVSDRLVADITAQVEAAASSTAVNGYQFRPPFFSLDLKNRNLGHNRYALAMEATEAVEDLTGSLAYPGPFVMGRAHLSWWELKVHENPVVRVGWIVARQDADEGRFLLAMCGSLEHFVGRGDAPSAPAAWRPSALPGLSNLLKAFNHEAGRKYKVDENPHVPEDETKTLVLEAAHVSMMLREDVDGPIGRGRMEFLARIYWGLKGRLRLKNYRTDELEEYDGIYVGTPIWVRTIPGRIDGGGSAYGGVRIVEVLDDVE